MSFQDSGRRSGARVEARVDRSDYCYRLKEEIASIRTNVRLVDSMLENVEGCGDPNPVLRQGILDKLDWCCDKMNGAEKLFQEWSKVLRSNPQERMQSRFQHERLFAHFNHEVRAICSLRQRAMVIPKPRDIAGECIPASSGGVGAQPNASTTNSVCGLSDQGMNGAVGDLEREEGDLEAIGEEDLLIRKEVERSQYEGIKAVNSQVKEASSLFKNLSNMLVNQEGLIHQLDDHVGEALGHTIGAKGELNKTGRRVARQRKRQLALFLFVTIISIFLLWKNNFFFHVVELFAIETTGPFDGYDKFSNNVVIDVKGLEKQKIAANAHHVIHGNTPDDVINDVNKPSSNYLQNFPSQAAAGAQAIANIAKAPQQPVSLLETHANTDSGTRI